MTQHKDLFGNDDIESMYRSALAVPLADKVEIAISMIRSMENQALALSDDGFYVCFSGGKDSIVLERLFKMAGVKYQAWYNNVTIDPPELVRFIKKYYPEVKWNNSGMGPLPLRMAEESQGPPTRKARWCCEIYKEQGGTGFFKAIGVRADESPRRKGLWKTLNKNDNGGWIICPIVYWTERDIWAFIKMHDMPYCSLYDEVDKKGRKLFKRLGCIMCPMAGPKGQRRDLARWPGYGRLWMRGFVAYWARWKGVPRKDGKPRWIEKMQTVDDLWTWWISGKAYKGKGADCQRWLW